MLEDTKDGKINMENITFLLGVLVGIAFGSFIGTIIFQVLFV